MGAKTPKRKKAPTKDAPQAPPAATADATAADPEAQLNAEDRLEVKLDRLRVLTIDALIQLLEAGKARGSDIAAAVQLLKSTTSPPAALVDGAPAPGASPLPAQAPAQASTWSPLNAEERGSLEAPIKLPEEDTYLPF